MTDPPVVSRVVTSADESAAALKLRIGQAFGLRLAIGRASRRKDLWFVAGLLLLAVGLPLVAGAIAGSLEIPRNDDWSYRRIALELARTGRFALDGISETMIIGQIIFTLPFLWVSGLEPWAFTAAGVVFAIGGVLSAYALARRLLRPADAALAAGLLAIFPGYLAYAVSFMSDVPALSAQLLCLACGAIAIRARPVRMRWLLASALIGIVGFSIREFAIAAPASVLIAAVVSERRLRTWGFAIAVAATCAAIHLWRTSLPGQLPPLGPGYGSFTQAIQAFSSVAFVVAPAALVGAIRWREHIRRFDVMIGLDLGACLVTVRILQLVTQGSMPPIILENVASPWGVPSGAYLVGGRPRLFSDDLWGTVNGVALLVTVVVLMIGAGIAGAHLRRCGKSPRVVLSQFASPAGMLVLFAFAVMGGLIAFGLSRPVYDRYFWPLVPPVAVLFLYKPNHFRTLATPRTDSRVNLALRGSAALLTLLLAVVSVTFLFNSQSFDAARWVAGERLVQQGLSPDKVDAGYEWVGYHATTQGDPTRGLPFYRGWWPEFEPCGIVSSDPVPPRGGHLVGTTEYALNLVVGPMETLYLYRISTPDCT